MSRNLSNWGVLDEAGTDGAECSRKVASGVMGPKDMWRGWRGIGSRRVYVGVCTGSRSELGHGRNGLIP